MYGYVYMFTNLINNKKYIGKHKFDKPILDKQYITSGLLIKESINKYGIENFKHELIDVAETLAELNQKERFYIAHFNTMIPEGYNMTSGGDGAPDLSEESRKKLAYWAGKKQSDESNIKRSETLKQVPHTEEWVNKIREANKNQKPTELAKQRSSEVHKDTHWYNNGVTEIMCKETDIPEGFVKGRLKNPFPSSTGKVRTKQTCKNIGLSKKNSNWYNNGEKELMLKPDAIIPEGYSLGRLKLNKINE